MTDEQIISGIGTILRAYATAPLKDCEVHEGDQVGYEGKAGSVRILPVGGAEIGEAIGEQFAADVKLEIAGRITFSDSQANWTTILNLAKQIRYCLRGANRRLVIGSETTTRNTAITWTYGFEAEGDKLFRTCSVLVTYRATEEAAT